MRTHGQLGDHGHLELLNNPALDLVFHLKRRGHAGLGIVIPLGDGKE